MSLKLIMINWILQPSDFCISKININRQLELTICWHQSPLLWNKSPNCGRSCDCVSQSSSSVIGAGREQRGHGASVASLSIIRLCAALTVLQRQRHIHVPTCHFPAPVLEAVLPSCHVMFFMTSWHIMAMNIYLPSVGVLLKGHNKWWWPDDVIMSVEALPPTQPQAIQYLADADRPTPRRQSCMNIQYTNTNSFILFCFR